MKRILSAKRYWTLVGILLLLLLLWGITYVVKHRGQPFAKVEVSDLYRRYTDVEGVTTIFVKDYRVDDTTCIDVTLLRATDSVGLSRLKKDFGIRAELLSPVSNRIVFLQNDSNVCDPSDRLSMCIYSPHDSTVSLFHINSAEQKFALISRKLDEISTTKK